MCEWSLLPGSLDGRSSYLYTCNTKCKVIFPYKVNTLEAIVFVENEIYKLYHLKCYKNH